MGIRQIVQIPDPILREKAMTVTKFNANLHKLLDDMAATMVHAQGVGLAAPQVGISKRVIVIDTYDERSGGLIEFVNPVIVEKSGEQIGTEGCLSIQGLNGEVKRYKRIVVEGHDRHGQPLRMVAEDFLAVVFQHEIDHLNGILFTDIANQVYEVNRDGAEKA